MAGQYICTNAKLIISNNKYIAWYLWQPRLFVVGQVVFTVIIGASVMLAGNFDL